MCRFFLGCVEASFFPGAIYFLSRWYTRSEMQLRVTVLNLGNLAAQGFGGLIAAGILANMEGAGGIRAWKWLFVIEGAVTVAFGIVGAFILPDYPDTTAWLSARERYIAERRLALDVGIVEEKEDSGALSGLRMAVTDPKVWLLGLAYHCTIMGLSVSRVSASHFYRVHSADGSPSSCSSSHPSRRLLATIQPSLFSVCSHHVP